MAGSTFLRQVAGILTEIRGAQTSAGVANAGDIPALDSSGRLDSSLLPTGVAPDVLVAPASENLAAGDFVNIWNSSGVKVRKADASSAGKEAHGFVLVAVLSAANATVFFEGRNSGVTGLTIGQKQYLSDGGAGGVTATPPTTAAHIVQPLGIAVATTEINTEIDSPITLA